MTTIQNQTFDQERALYGVRDLLVRNCAFDGPADGESAFKECADVEADHCFFNLRYPFWHDEHLTIRNSEMTELCRAAVLETVCVYGVDLLDLERAARHQDPAFFAAHQEEWSAVIAQAGFRCEVRVE